MRARVSALLLSPFVLASIAVSAAAQPNVVAGRDISMSSLGGVFQNAHSGIYPNGVVALGLATTACNPRTVSIPWFAQPDPNHPFIAFLIARETAGRFTQISNRSYCKHPFSSTNTPGCTPSCTGGPSQSLVVGCSDTYGGSLNASYSLLGPPDEIDPWTGIWSMMCSYFDVGVPPQPTCDGQSSSITYASGTAPPRCNVNDSDLTVPGSTYYAQAGWITAGELESLRGNNFVSRGFVPTFGGGSWSFGSLTAQLPGSILQRWSGATLDSNTNGADDGRLFVAVKVTGPTNGLFHYEFAVHNRDNDRGVAAFRLPICPGARVENAGFKDIDTNAGNDWSFFQTPSEISWAGAATNALRWNSIFNFWFDSDAAPVTGSSVLLDPADAGPGLASVSVTTRAPVGLYNVHLGPGCGAGASPVFFATGTPDRAAIPNASFALGTTGNAPNAPVGLLYASVPGILDLGSGCSLYAASVSAVSLLAVSVCDPSGAFTFAASVPNDPSLEGQSADFQAHSLQADGPFLGSFAFSNGLRVRIGNSIPTCP